MRNTMPVWQKCSYKAHKRTWNRWQHNCRENRSNLCKKHVGNYTRVTLDKWLAYTQALVVSNHMLERRCESVALVDMCYIFITTLFMCLCVCECACRQTVQAMATLMNDTTQLWHILWPQKSGSTEGFRCTLCIL